MLILRFSEASHELLLQESVSSGLNLQRFIQDDNKWSDNQLSESVANLQVVDKKQKFPNFALIEEVEKNSQPLFYDVPIKIEETNPGDDIRTIYVPIENAINVPDSVALGLQEISKVPTTLNQVLNHNINSY